MSTLRAVSSEIENFPLGAGFAVIDVETTGVSPRTSRIVELAVLLLDVDGKAVGEMATLIRPEAHMGATEIHGINARDVRNAPTFREVAPLLVAGLRGRVPVAHNVPFELRMLTAEFRRLGWDFEGGELPGLCTMALAESYLSPLPGRRLSDCCRAAGYDLTAAHAALEDARGCAHLFRTYRRAHDTLPSSWADALHAAQQVRWPDMGDQPSAALLPREVAAYQNAVEVPYLARLVASLPRATGVSAITQSYLAALDLAMADRLVTREEAGQLSDLAEALQLGAQELLDVHRSYLLAVAVAALADDVLTDAEMADLQQVAHLLALTTADLQDALERAASTPAEPRTVEAFLSLGDRLVITGDTVLVPRQELERMTVEAGLRLVSAVSGKTKLLVVADPHTQTRKAQKAREVGTRIVGEAVYLQMLEALAKGLGGLDGAVPAQPSISRLPVSLD